MASLVYLFVIEPPLYFPSRFGLDEPCFVAAIVSLAAALVTATGYGRNSRVPASVDPGRDGNEGRS
ncbi:hypothetical protein [Nocardia testacea]|uniref:hypothetical protein n=1 Tax=Nocardia testacea TaxID=248551 RepID=UPI003A8C40A1